MTQSVFLYSLGAEKRAINNEREGESNDAYLRIDYRAGPDEHDPRIVRRPGAGQQVVECDPVYDRPGLLPGRGSIGAPGCTDRQHLQRVGGCLLPGQRARSGHSPAQGNPQDEAARQVHG